MHNWIEKIINIGPFSVGFGFYCDDSNLNRELEYLIWKVTENLNGTEWADWKSFALWYAEIKIKSTSDNRYALEEFMEEDWIWNHDLTRALYYLKRQLDFCNQYNLEFSEIPHNSLVWTNFWTSLKDKANFEVCRYDLSNHSWLLIIDRHFDGDMRKVKLHHLSHLIQDDPGLIDIVWIGAWFYVNITDGFLRAGREGVQ